MQKLMQSRLLRLLSEVSQNEVSISELEESCDEFALEVLTRLQLEDKPQELYFSLGFVHSKLAGVRERLSGGQGENGLKIVLKAAHLVELGMQVLEWRITVPNNGTKYVSENKFLFSGNDFPSYYVVDGKELETEANDSSYFYPKVRLTWTGSKVDLVELIYAWETARCFNHGHANIKEFVAYIEVVFNIDKWLLPYVH